MLPFLGEGKATIDLLEMADNYLNVSNLMGLITAQVSRKAA